MPDAQAPEPAIRKLKPRHQAIVKAYTTPGPTLGNLRAAGQAVDPSKTPVAAKMEAWRALKLPEVRAAVDEAMAEFGAGHNWRIKTLRDVADPKTILTEERETIHPDGQTTKTITRRSPAPADIARIVDVLNKMDGTYSQQAAAAQVTARYQNLAHRFSALLANNNLQEEQYVPQEVKPKPKRVGKRKGATRTIGCIPIIYRGFKRTKHAAA